MQLQTSEPLQQIMLARYYGDGLPRFISPDPLGGSAGRPQSWNRYAYVLGNPMRLVDPSGMMSVIPDTGGGWGREPISGWHNGPGGIAGWGNIPCVMCSGAAGGEDDFKFKLTLFEKAAATLDPVLNSPAGNAVSQGVVGFGDAASFGIVPLLRSDANGSEVETGSASYLAGTITGSVVATVAFAGATAESNVFKNTLGGRLTQPKSTEFVREYFRWGKHPIPGSAGQAVWHFNFGSFHLPWNPLLW